MRGHLRNRIGMLAVAGLVAVLGGCGGGLGEISTTNLLPRVDAITRPDWLSYSGGKEDFSLRPVTANDLVSQQGQCATPAGAAPATPAGDEQSGSPQGAPLLAGGIALQMTECDVVLRIGHPEQLEFGTNERGDRTVVITYLRGNRPGVYRFSAGRLVSIERPPGPAPTERPQKGKAAKKART
jgi:hypothetical protein